MASDCECCDPYDLIVIDGEHSAEAVQSDLVAASWMLAAGGLIALHDLAGKWGPYVQAGIEGFCGSGTCWKLEVKENVGFIRAR